MILFSSFLALLIIVRQPKHPIGWLLYLAGLAFGLVELVAELTIYTNFSASNTSDAAQIAWINNWIWVVPFAIYFWTMAIFPGGHLPSRRWRWVLAIITLWASSMVFAGFIEPTMTSAFNIPNPLPVAALATLHPPLFSFFALPLMPLSIASIAVLMVYRFRRAQGDERQQIKWLAGSVLLVMLTIVAGVILRFFLNLTIGETFFNLSLVYLPVGISIAVLRYRLYDIDIIIRRTLVYGTITALGLGIYWLVVGATSTLLQTQNNLVSLIIALVVVVFLFSPVRRQLTSVLDRFMPLPTRPDIAETQSTATPVPDEAPLNNPVLIWLLATVVFVLVALNLFLFFLNWSTLVPAGWNFEGGLRNTPITIFSKMSSIIFYVIPTSIMGLLLVFHRPRHPIGWLLYLTACILGFNEMLSEYVIYTNFTRPDTPVSGQFAAFILNSLWVLLFTFNFWTIAIFPDGHLPGPRWRWLYVSIAVWTISMFSTSALENPLESAYGLPNPLPTSITTNISNGLTIFSLTMLAVTAIGLAVLQIYRFRQSQDEERQQIKWLVGAVLLTAILIITGIILRFVLNLFIGEFFLSFALAFVPVSIGVAILRHRLYDIDIIIRRTLIYGGLVGGLALAYFGSVVLIQFMSQALTGPQSNLVVVAITLAIAALFNPVRTRFQAWIDRRFYREKVDARQALIAFAREVRAIIDLPELLRALVTRTTDLLHISHGAVFLVDESGAFHLAEERNLSTQNGNIHDRIHQTLPPTTETPPTPAVQQAPITTLPLEEIDLPHLQDGHPLSRPTDKAFPLLIPLIAPTAQASNLQPPTSSPHSLIGILALGPRLSDQHYSREDQTLLTGLADQAGTAIYVAQLIEERQAEAVRREESERQLEAYRNSPMGRAEALAQELINQPEMALIEMHALAQSAGQNPETANLLEHLSRAIGYLEDNLLTGFADGYNFIFSSLANPELLPVGLRSLTEHLALPDATTIQHAPEALVLYQLCQQALEVNSIPQITELLSMLPPQKSSGITNPTDADAFLGQLTSALAGLRPAADALHAYQRVDASQDKLAYLASAVERLSHVDRLAQAELGSADRPIIRRIAELWLAVITGAMSDLQTQARIACRLLTRHTWTGEIISLALALRNEGRGAALNLKVSLMMTPEYTLLDEAVQIERLAAGEETQVELRVRPRLEQNISQFRARFVILYDDPRGPDQVENFADVVFLLDDEGEFQFIRNPYVVGTPLQSGSNLFFGREDIISFIQENLAAAHQNNLVLIGQRRTGKTSLLKQLQTRLGDEYMPVYLDGQSLALDPGLPNFFLSLATEITFALEDYGFELEEFFDLPDFTDSPAAAFERRFLSAVRNAIGERHLLLLLDEFEELETAVRRGNIDASIFGFLRHLIQHTDNLSVIFCGTHRMEELAADYWSVLFNISLYRHVAFLSNEEALRLIQEPVADYNMRYDDLALDKMWRVTAGHPYFLQLLCHSLVNHHNKSERNYITVADVNAALDEILAAGEAHFVYLWTESSQEERLALTVLSRMMPLTGQVTPVQVSDYLAEHGVNLDRRTVNQTLHHLTLRDILRTGGSNGSEANDAYRWQLGLLGLWVEKYKSLSRVVDEV